MGMLFAESRQTLQEEQIGESVFGPFWYKFLSLPGTEEPGFDFEEATDFLAGVRTTRVVLKRGSRMARVVSQHRKIIASGREDRPAS
jgi:hypothetical protein